MSRTATLFAAILFAGLVSGGCATSGTVPADDGAAAAEPVHFPLEIRKQDIDIERAATDAVKRELPSARVAVACWNGQLLLAGQVPTAADRSRLEQRVRAIEHVVHVHNELEVGEPISRAARAMDATISGRVRSALAFSPDVPSRRVKVVTENGVVYLLGTVSREEATRVVDKARHVAGVQKIVKIFDYLP